MTFQGDPYRTLGLARDASLNEIRSAYRRLAKQYHPDAAGERALARFLAIQAAYEQLVDGEGRLRATRPGGSARARGGGEPWRADPARARASRDAWRARWARSGSAGRDRAGDAPAGGASGPSRGRSQTGPGAGARRRADSGGSTAGREGGPDRGATGESRSPGGRPPGERRHHAGPANRKATPGSTTYDEARESPLDPAWEGGAWYGPTSGTYWTLNPREYADPRKHGPEYLARARRAAGDQGPGPSAAGAGIGPAAASADAGIGPADASADETTFSPPPATPGNPAPDAGGTWEWTGTARTTTDGGEAEWQARAWSFEARRQGPAWTTGPEADRLPGDRPPDGSAGHARGAGATSTTPDVAPRPPDLESVVRLALPEHLLALARRDDRRWRLVLALVAWPPLGWLLGSLVSMATGCASFSAVCPEPVPILLLLAQPLVVAALFAMPVVTAVGAFASLAALAVAIPAAAILSVGAMPRPTVEPVVLGVVVGASWAIALVAAAVRVRNGPRPSDPAP